MQHLAQKIGEAGQRFALDHWNWANMQAYVSGPSHCGGDVAGTNYSRRLDYCSSCRDYIRWIERRSRIMVRDNRVDRSSSIIWGTSIDVFFGYMMICAFMLLLSCWTAGGPRLSASDKPPSLGSTMVYGHLRLMWTDFSEVSPRLDAPIFERVRILA